MTTSTNLMVITAPCWKCDKQMLVALVGDDNGNMGYGPKHFSDEEEELAKKSGVLLKEAGSNTAGETYLANICSDCGAFVGEWFYFTNYYTEALYGRLKYRRVG